MKRTNPKDNDDPGWVRISWEEAFSTITQKLEETAEKYSGLSVFGMSGTSRQWGMLAYGALGQLVGSPNMGDPVAGVQGPRFFGTSLTRAMPFLGRRTCRVRRFTFLGARRRSARITMIRAERSSMWPRRPRRISSSILA